MARGREGEERGNEREWILEGNKESSLEIDLPSPLLASADSTSPVSL